MSYLHIRLRIGRDCTREDELWCTSLESTGPIWKRLCSCDVATNTCKNDATEENRDAPPPTFIHYAAVNTETSLPSMTNLPSESTTKVHLMEGKL